MPWRSIGHREEAKRILKDAAAEGRLVRGAWYKRVRVAGPPKCTALRDGFTTLVLFEDAYRYEPGCVIAHLALADRGMLDTPEEWRLQKIVEHAFGLQASEQRDLIGVFDNGPVGPRVSATAWNTNVDALCRHLDALPVGG